MNGLHRLFTLDSESTNHTEFNRIYHFNVRQSEELIMLDNPIYVHHISFLIVKVFTQFEQTGRQSGDRQSPERVVSGDANVNGIRNN